MNTKELTPTQRNWYNNPNTTAGRKSHFTKQFNKFNGNTPEFKSWFNKYKKAKTS